MKNKFKCSQCGKNNGGEFASGVCEPCADILLTDMVAG